MAKLLIPWSLPSHQKLGGFDPLLRHWMQSQDSAIDFQRPPWPYEFNARPLDAESEFRWGGRRASEGYGKAFDLPEVAALFDHRDLEMAAQIATDFELLHTVPLTLGRHPFIFICRSLGELFTPFTKTGMATPQGALSSILPIYRSLFGSPDCLGVAFFLNSDLKAFARLFPEAESKLHLLTVSTPPTAPAPRLPAAPPTLMFTTWSRSADSEIVLDGGLMAIQALDELRRRAPEARLIFAARDGRARLLEPSTQTAEGRVLGLAGVRSLIERNLDHIIWTDDHLTEPALMRLLQSSDALVSAGAQTDPMLVLMAMTQGCIPLVSNTCGAEEWVSDGHTGGVMKTLDQTVLSINEYGFTDTLHQAFYDGHEEILGRTTRALEPWIDLLTDPDRRALFKADMTARTERRFQSLAGHSQIAHILGEAQGGAGHLWIGGQLNYARDFQSGRGDAVLSLAHRQVRAVNGGFAVASQADGSQRLHPTMSVAMADLVGRETRSANEILREAIVHLRNPSISPREVMEPLANRTDVRVRDLSRLLQGMPIAKSALGGYLASRSDGLAVLPDPLPWGYGLVLNLDPAALIGGDWLVVETGPTENDFGLALLNATGDAFVERVLAPGHKASVEVWLPIRSSGDVSALVLQNWRRPMDREVVLRRLSLVGTDTGVMLAMDSTGPVTPLAGQDTLERFSIDFDDPRYQPHLTGESRRTAEGLLILPPPSPWTYGVNVPLQASPIKGAGAVVVQLSAATTPVGLGLLDTGGDSFVVRTKTPDDIGAIEVWLPFDDASQVSSLVIHNWDMPLEAPVLVMNVFLVGADRPD